MNRSGNWKEESLRLCLRNRIEFQRDENNNNISSLMDRVVEEEPFQQQNQHYHHHLPIQQTHPKLTLKRNLFKDQTETNTDVSSKMCSIHLENNQMDCQTSNETASTSTTITKKRTFIHAFDEDLDYDSKRIKHVSSNENFLQQEATGNEEFQDISIIEMSHATFFIISDGEMDRDESPKIEKNPRATATSSSSSSSSSGISSVSSSVY